MAHTLENPLTGQKVKVSGIKASDPPTVYSPIKNHEALQHMGEVMSILSKHDALTIFLLAKDGLKSELETPSEIGLTKKQYYTRLKQLSDLKLIAKNEDSYVHTTFGSLVCEKHVIDLINDVENMKELEMIDVLKRSSKFNSDEISNFLSKIGMAPNNRSSVKEFALMTNYDDMVSKAIELIEFAQSEVLLSTRFLNDLIVNSNLKKARSGVPVRVIADASLVSEYFNEEKTVVKEDKNKDERVNVVSNPYYPSNIERRYASIPFSILIVDGKHVGIEIIDSYNTLKFKMALYISDKSFADAMKSHFESLWQFASSTPPQILEKKN